MSDFADRKCKPCEGGAVPLGVGAAKSAMAELHAAWKLDEDSHLIFRGGSKIQSAQAVALVKDDWFLTGHEDGHLCLWLAEKKKAVATIEHAHGPGNEGLIAGCHQQLGVRPQCSSRGSPQF